MWGPGDLRLGVNENSMTLYQNRRAPGPVPVDKSECHTSRLMEDEDDSKLNKFAVLLAHKLLK